jgi:hypothetical protein
MAYFGLPFWRIKKFFDRKFAGGKFVFVCESTLAGLVHGSQAKSARRVRHSTWFNSLSNKNCQHAEQ